MTATEQLNLQTVNISKPVDQPKPATLADHRRPLFLYSLTAKRQGMDFFPPWMQELRCVVLFLNRQKDKKNQHSGDLEMKKGRDLLYMQNTDLQQP